jgi:methylisocitrate lyase
MKEETMGVSRRDFGKTVAMGGLGAMAGAPLAAGQGGGSPMPKRMTTVFKELLKSPGIKIAPCVFDAFGARNAEHVGFPCLSLAGSMLGYSTCQGEPGLSLRDLVETTFSITAAVNIPLMIDAGAGYGEAVHVIHTVQALEQAGAVAAQIDDQIYPKRFHYHEGIEHLISAEAMLEKLHCALEARRDKDFVIIGRSDAMRTTSFAEGVRRANLYAEAGCDLIHVFPNNPDEAKRAPKEISGNLIFVNGFGAGARPIYPAEQLEEWGYKAVYILGLFHVRYKAERDVLLRLKKTGSTGLDANEFRALQVEMDGVIGMPEKYRIENETTEKT